MDPRKFLDLAKTLHQSSAGEAAFRTSVNRSYYALHNWIVMFLERNNVPMPKAAAKHRKALLMLQEVGIPEIRAVATALGDLLTERNMADYELQGTRFQSQKKAELIHMKAEGAYNQFSLHTKTEEKRNKLMQGIRDYEKRISP